MYSRFVVALRIDFCNFVSSVKYIVVFFLCIIVNHQMKLNAKHCSLLKFQAFLSWRKHTEKNLQKARCIFLTNTFEGLLHFTKNELLPRWFLFLFFIFFFLFFIFFFFFLILCKYLWKWISFGAFIYRW